MASSTILLALAFVVIVPCTCRSHRRLLENYDAGLQPAAPLPPGSAANAENLESGILRKSGDRAREAIAGAAAASCL